MLFAACCLAASCSDEKLSAVSDGQEQRPETLRNANLTVIFQLPTETVSRASEKGRPDTSITAENRVSSALVVLGKMANGSTTPLTVHSVHRLTDLQMVGNDTQWMGKIKVAPGFYRVFVIANPPQDETLINTKPDTDWSKFVMQSLSFKKRDYSQVESLWRENAFMMTNAFLNTIDEHDVELVAGKDNTVTINVQRVCSRFDYRPLNQNNVYTTKVMLNGVTAQPVDIHLTDMALMNVSNNFHLLKQISPDETGYTIAPHEHETGSNYVADSDWNIKKLIYAGMLGNDRLGDLFFFGSESDAPLKYYPLPTALLPDGEYRRMCYATENTIPGENKQVNKLSTGVVFKGHFFLMKVSGNEVYFFQHDDDNKYMFTDYNKLRDYLLRNEGIALPVTVDKATDALLAHKGVKRFRGSGDGRFPVWYTYWNRHNNNNNKHEMGIMEFATVRNNVYRLTVNTIGTLGLPKEPIDPDNPWVPKGETPDEPGLELDVRFEVSAWVERIFEHEI